MEPRFVVPTFRTPRKVGHPRHLQSVQYVGHPAVCLTNVGAHQERQSLKAGPPAEGLVAPILLIDDWEVPLRLV